MLVTGVAVSTVWFPAVQAVFPTFIGGILGIVSLYFTGNVANKFVVGKTEVEMKATEIRQGNDEGAAA